MADSKKTLVIAGGGGGDALGALMVTQALGLDDAEVAYATIVWERSLYDPQPGPRSPEDFASIESVGAHNHRIGPDHQLRAPAMTFVPQLAEAFGVSYYLMDIARGARHVQQQIAELQALHDFEDILVVDVGGDILARGDEEKLRSPTADSMALAGVYGVDADVRVAVTGLGLDGELTEDDMAAIRDELAVDAAYAPPTPITKSTAEAFSGAFQWLPSEVSGMTCAAALGYHGTAEIRRSGLRVDLTEDSHTIRVYPYADVLERNEIARASVETTSLRETEDVVRSFGLTSEVDLERRSNGTISTTNGQMVNGELEELQNELLTYTTDVKEEGVQYLSQRRIAKVLGLNRTGLDHFKEHLHDTYPDRLQPPVWIC